MTPENNQSRKVFISYSHKDKLYKEELVKQLKPYELIDKLIIWDDGELIVGQE